MCESNDPNWKTGYNGYNSPANNTPDALYEYNRGVQDRERRDREAREQADRAQRERERERHNNKWW